MNVGSLFTGIGGFDLGLERAGMRVVWQCEQNEYRRQVLARHWPGVPCYPDVRALVADTEGRGNQRQGVLSRLPLQPVGCGEEGLVSVSVPPVDLICGGFPCQDLSLAGKGAGIEGSRSGLWFEFARIIGDLRPRYVVVENVPALLHRGMWRVLEDLAALGYDAEWDCLPASAFGAPHRRDRLWLVAYPQGDGCGERRQGRLVGAGARQANDTRPAHLPDSMRPGLEGRGVRGTARDGGGERDVADAERQGRHGLHERVEPRHLATDARNGGRDGTERPAAEDHSRGVSGQGPRGSTNMAGTGLRADGSGGQRGRRPSDGRCPQGPWTTEPDVGRVAHGVPARVDRLSALGDSLVPQIAEWIGQRILEAEKELAA